MPLCIRLNETEGLSLEQLENCSKKLKKKKKMRQNEKDVEERRVVGVERRGGEKGVEQ